MQPHRPQTSVLPTLELYVVSVALLTACRSPFQCLYARHIFLFPAENHVIFICPYIFNRIKCLQNSNNFLSIISFIVSSSSFHSSYFCISYSDFLYRLTNSKLRTKRTHSLAQRSKTGPLRNTFSVR
jgi:hypothetical protein